MSNPLKYNISSWEQAVECQSNYSNLLHIRVSTLMDNVLKGTLLQVEHEELGVLFSYVIDGYGPLLASDNPVDFELTCNEILQELKRYGFLITYDCRAHLPEDQLTYLKTIHQLGYDKLRLLYVYTINNQGVRESEPHIIVFNIEPNPGWLDNSYSARKSDFLNALSEGSAIDLTQMSECKRFHWDWLDYVASIQDILDDNAKES